MGLLDRIVAAKARENAAFLAGLNEPIAYRQGIEDGLLPAGRLRESLNTRRANPHNLAVIAECKKASPSSGLIRPQYDARVLAHTYLRLGAAAASVLTDGEFFQGSLADAEAAVGTGIPVLRKDFILYDEQVYEAARIGAAGILLIVRLLGDADLGRLLRLADRLHLDVLVETHNEEEVRRALDAGASVIGVNHRDLDTLQIDLSLTERCAPLIRRSRSDALIVAESGVEDRAFLARLDGIADAVLIGTYFMKSPDITAAWHALFD